MWNYFKNRRLKKELKIQEEKDRIARIKSEIRIVKDRYVELADIHYDSSRKYNNSLNNKCPKCKSEEVNERVKRIQGDIKGDFSGSGSSFLGFGSSSSSGKIRGSLDTNGVNKCNTCQHEWKISNPSYVSCRDLIESDLSKIRWRLSEYKDIQECKFDPLDLSEEFNSLEEKVNKLKTDYENRNMSLLRKYWSGISVDTLKEIFKQYDTTSGYRTEQFLSNYNEDVLSDLGFIITKNK